MHLFSKENPYRGDAIVAFVDLLGFSHHVKTKWGAAPDPLETILSLKREVGRAGFLTVEFPAVRRQAQVTTMSDSIVITAPVERENPHTFYAAYLAVWNACENCMAMSIDKEFMVRGGIELGAIYRADAEIIGPGFIDAYILESRVADVARIVVGPETLDFMREHQTEQAFTDHTTLYQSDDGLIVVRPTSRKSMEVRALRDKVADQPQLARKYDEFIRRMDENVPWGHGQLSNVQLQSAADLTRRLMCQPKDCQDQLGRGSRCHS